VTAVSNSSPVLHDLLDHAEEILGIEILVHRQTETPPYGLLLDEYTYDTNKNVIVFSNSQLGLLKDFVVAQNCIRLLMRGCASKKGNYKVLSLDTKTASDGMNQIYLDTLKDDKTRNLEVWQKKKLMYYLYMLFHESMLEVPWTVISNMYISRAFPVLQNAQTYFLIKESMRDMHDLVSFKDMLPRRYFVLHNAMYYARDMFLAEITAELKLNPMINIPELQKFKNLDVKEMMSHRWSKSYWYHTKIVGDAMTNILRMTSQIDSPTDTSEDFFYRLYELGTEITNRWLMMMRMQDWYRWESPAHLRETEQKSAEIEAVATNFVFGI
jgi:hypothetical protein